MIRGTTPTFQLKLADEQVDLTQALNVYATFKSREQTITKSGADLEVTGTYSGEGVRAQAKTATPTTSQQTILPDANYDYLSQVTVNAIPYVETANTYGTTVTIG